jgi:hypothetical protein
MTKMRFTTLLSAAALAAMFAVACSDVPTQPTALAPDEVLRYTSQNGIVPVVIPGGQNTDKTCGVLIPGSIELKQEPFNASGNLNDGTLFVSWVKPSTLYPLNPNTLDWTSNIAVLGVVVKDGVDGANFYDYRPGGSLGDKGLSTPFQGDKGISHVSWCYIPDVFTPRGEVTVEKTAETSFTRTHDWSIDKRVETENGHELDDIAKIWLYTDGSGDETATWYVDVTYEGYEDSAGKVYGDIYIANTGNIRARIDDVEDELDIPGVNVTVTCDEDLPYILDLGDTLECTYESDEFDPEDGTNTVTVTGKTLHPDDATEFGDVDETDTADFEFDEPTTELHATVDVKDLSDLFGEELLGTLDAADYDAGDIIPFDYDKEFSFEDFEECGPFRYDNTATVYGDEDEVLDEADASLKVNVQCYVFESAWAEGTEEDVDVLAVESFCENGFSNWGWVNLIAPLYEGLWPLYAGAAQCDPSKGTLVGHFQVKYNGGAGNDRLEYEFIPLLGLDVIFEDEAVYANGAKFPKLRNGTDTTAPGQYYIANPLLGEIWVIAHVNAGIPDPDFGP